MTAFSMPFPLVYCQIQKISGEMDVCVFSGLKCMVVPQCCLRDKEKKIPTNKVMEEYVNLSNFLIGHFRIFNHLLPVSSTYYLTEKKQPFTALNTL